VYRATMHKKTVLTCAVCVNHADKAAHYYDRLTRFRRFLTAFAKAVFLAQKD
jgi:hypothetical protein